MTTIDNGDRINDRINQFNTQLTTRIDQVNARVNDRVDNLMLLAIITVWRGMMAAMLGIIAPLVVLIVQNG